MCVYRYSYFDDFLHDIVEQSNSGKNVASTIHSESWSSCMYLLDQVEQNLENNFCDAHHQIVSSRHKPDVVGVIENGQFVAQGKDWSQDLKKEIDNLPNNSNSPYHKWLFVRPKPLIPLPHFDQVPMIYWLKLWKDFYQYLPRNFDRGQGGKFSHAVVSDPFYIESLLHKNDLGRWKKHIEGYTHSYSPEVIFAHNEAMQNVKISNLAGDLSSQYDQCEEFAYARAILVKKFLGGITLTGSVSLSDTDGDKLADMILLEISEGNSQLSFYWSKFGSLKKLRKEHTNTRNLRRRKTELRQFLYITHLGKSPLQADYLNILVSEHEEVQHSETRTLQQFYRELVENGRLNQLQSVFQPLGEFFDALHYMGSWKNVSRFMADKEGTKYDYLLTSARYRSNVSGNILVRPGENQPGNYNIELIVPRDSHQESSDKNSSKERVVVYLTPQNPNLADQHQRLLLGWTEQDWRWKFWRQGFQEGLEVNLEQKVKAELQSNSSLRAGSRLSGHLQNFRDAFEISTNQEYFQRQYQILLDNLEQILDVRFHDANNLKEITSDGTCTVNSPDENSPLLWYDVYPNYLHGDFHPRNVLVLEQQDNLEVKIIDLAFAIVDENDLYPAPMAYDFAVFEVDAKAKMVIDIEFSEYIQDSTMGNNDLKLLEALDKEESLVWDWSRENLADCFTSSWNNYQNDFQPFPQPDRVNFGNGFYFVAAWRNFCLPRLWRMTQLQDDTDRNILSKVQSFADSTEQNNLQRSNWTAARSYAQALFLASIGYLKLLDPDSNQGQMRGLACIVSAIHALNILNSPNS
ncbi:MAG: hypothetical protein WBA93_34660 [Microcoleaceae cyanobacterium]